MKLEKNKTTSIAKKVITFVILINLFVSIIVLLFQIKKDREDFDASLKERFENLERGTTTLGVDIYGEDEPKVMSFLKGLIAQDDFSYTFISEPDDKEEILYEFPPKDALPGLNKNFEKRVIKVFVTDESSKEHVADLTIFASKNRIDEKIKSKINFFGGVQLVQIFLNVFLIFFVFKSLVGKHLAKMAVYAQNLDLNNLKSEDLILDRPSSKKQDELESLVLSINIMKQNLDKTHKSIKDYTLNLEDKVKDATAEIMEEKNNVATLLNNMKTAVFSIGKDYKITPPVSQYSQNIFKKDIVGLKASEFLFINVKKGTKEFSDLVSGFDHIFKKGTELDYLIGKDYLPKKITLPDEENEMGMILKLDYSPLFNQEKMVEKLLVMVDDVTDIEGDYKQAKNDQLHFKFLKEIILIDDKELLSKKLEIQIQNIIYVLDDFVSPLSDTYGKDHFVESFKNCYAQLMINIQNNLALKEKLSEIVSEKDLFDTLEKASLEIKFQLQLTSLLCDILDCVLIYMDTLKILYPVKFKIDKHLSATILEKINDIEKIFRNLFEYVFLVREIDSISKEKLQKVVQVAKLYPEFERTIDLIHQRTKVLSFLLRAFKEEELSGVYENLSSLVKQIAGIERKNLNESNIKNNLIDPYRIVLEKTSNIQEIFEEKGRKAA